jgi:hypothetical protein
MVESKGNGRMVVKRESEQYERGLLSDSGETMRECLMGGHFKTPEGQRYIVLDIGYEGSEVYAEVRFYNQKDPQRVRLNDLLFS